MGRLHTLYKWAYPPGQLAYAQYTKPTAYKSKNKGRAEAWIHFRIPVPALQSAYPHPAMFNAKKQALRRHSIDA
jgi:hypothetical protein